MNFLSLLSWFVSSFIPLFCFYYLLIGIWAIYQPICILYHQNVYGINATHKNDAENAGSRKMTYSEVILEMNLY